MSLGQPCLALVAVTSIGTARSRDCTLLSTVAGGERTVEHGLELRLRAADEIGWLLLLLLLLTVTLTQQHHPLSPRIRHSLMGVMLAIGDFSHYNRKE